MRPNGSAGATGTAGGCGGVRERYDGSAPTAAVTSRNSVELCESVRAEEAVEMREVGPAVEGCSVEDLEGLRERVAKDGLVGEGRLS